jgi:hypothetical protein
MVEFEKKILAFSCARKAPDEVAAPVHSRKQAGEVIRFPGIEAVDILSPKLLVSGENRSNLQRDALRSVKLSADSISRVDVVRRNMQEGTGAVAAAGRSGIAEPMGLEITFCVPDILSRADGTLRRDYIVEIYNALESGRITEKRNIEIEMNYVSGNLVVVETVTGEEDDDTVSAFNAAATRRALLRFGAMRPSNLQIERFFRITPSQRRLWTESGAFERILRKEYENRGDSVLVHGKFRRSLLRNGGNEKFPFLTMKDLVLISAEEIQTLKQDLSQSKNRKLF